MNFPPSGSPEQLYHDQWEDPDTACYELKRLADKYHEEGYEVVLVGEQFDKRPGVINPDYTAKYVNRDVENTIFDYEIVWQVPAAAKNLVKYSAKAHDGRDGLHRFGFYLIGRRHANDATRHALVYAVEKLKHKATILLGWPRKDDH